MLLSWLKVWTSLILSGYKRHNVLSRELAEEGRTSLGNFIFYSPGQWIISKISITTVGVYSFLEISDVVKNFISRFGISKWELVQKLSLTVWPQSLAEQCTRETQRNGISDSTRYLSAVRQCYGSWVKFKASCLTANSFDFLWLLKVKRSLFRVV